MRKTVIHCKNSFVITGKGIIVFLQHKELGLPEGTILKSEKTDKRWEIKTRILCDHAINFHKTFDIESVNYMRLSFKNPEKKDHSLQQIIQEESNHTYQYFVEPLNHDASPLEGEELVLEII